MSQALHLVLGDDEFLAARAVAEVVQAARSADPETIVEELVAQELTVGALLGAVSPSLFGGQRVVVILNGQDARKDEAAAILTYVANPEPDVTLVVTHAGGAKGKALADGLRGAGATVVTVPKPLYDKRNEFVRQEFRRLGVRVGNDAVNLLVEAIGSSTRELASACQQLVADTGGKVTADEVARYYRGRAEVNGFTISDEVMAGNLAGALESLRWALQTGVDPVPIADALADGVRTASRVLSAGRGNKFDLAKSLGLHHFKVEKAQKWVAGWTPEGLVQAMRIVGVCNVDVRGGAENRDYALERAVTAIVGLRSGGRPARRAG